MITPFLKNAARKYNPFFKKGGAAAAGARRLLQNLFFDSLRALHGWGANFRESVAEIVRTRGIHFCEFVVAKGQG